MGKRLYVEHSNRNESMEQLILKRCQNVSLFATIDMSFEKAPEKCFRHEVNYTSVYLCKLKSDSKNAYLVAFVWLL